MPCKNCEYLSDSVERLLAERKLQISYNREESAKNAELRREVGELEDRVRELECALDRAGNDVAEARREGFQDGFGTGYQEGQRDAVRCEY